MAKLEILTYPDPRLAKKSEPVKKFGPEFDLGMETRAAFR